MSEARPVRHPRPGFPRSVRARLLAIVLLPMLVVMPLFITAVVVNWSTRVDRLLTAKVNGELTIAHQYMFSLLENRAQRVEALAASARFAQVLEGADLAAQAAFLARARQDLGLDFLYPARPGDDAARWPVVAQALAGRRAAGIDIFAPADLAAHGTGLAARARIPLVPTEAAAPTTRTTEDRGMVLHTAAPVPGHDLALVGGVLLNRNLDFIDTINDLVYPQASLTEGSRGTATLFLDDVRISTNVRLFENVRALGTRVSQVVRDRVLGQGEKWLGRAFVVNDWYISAYEPITDSFGNRVGMLYVGFLDSPYREARLRTILVVIGGFIALAALSVPVFLRWTRSIVGPLERMVATIDRVEAGDLSARTRLSGGQAEVAQVSAHLDDLLDQIEERDRRLRDWAGELERRVAARTQALSDANRQLEATTRQLVIAEKLAAIGEITAGIAHEINNPIAVIQGNLDVIRAELAECDTPDLETEFNLIYEQTHAINVLVGKLLQFARPEEYAGVIDHHIPDEVIADTIPLVQHLLNKVAIALELHLNADRPVAMNRTELQQVLINLITNAIHAMPDGGTLTISTENHDRDGLPGVLIRVQDTGTGMPPEVLSAIFDPFFTTKQAEGTGLGLSITRDLLDRAGGRIEATSTPGAGSRFDIWLPSVDP